MHEVGIAEKIVKAAVSQARALGYPKVSVVRVRLGAWASIEPDTLQHGFDTAARKNGIAGARLEVEVVEPSCICRDCGAAFEPEKFTLRCESCGSRNVVLENTREFEVESVGV